jgi:hypothetical protein
MCEKFFFLKKKKKKKKSKMFVVLCFSEKCFEYCVFKSALCCVLKVNCFLNVFRREKFETITKHSLRFPWSS